MVIVNGCLHKEDLGGWRTDDWETHLLLCILFCFFKSIYLLSKFYNNLLKMFQADESTLSHIKNQTKQLS